MSRILIVLGARDHKPDAALSVVYVGRDASALARALAASPYPAHLIIKNPVCIRKHNGDAKGNLDKLVLEDRSMEKDTYTCTKEEMDGFLGELKRLQDLANARATEIAALKEQLAAQPAPTSPPSQPVDESSEASAKEDVSPAPENAPPPVDQASPRKKR